MSDVDLDYRDNSQRFLYIPINSVRIFGSKNEWNDVFFNMENNLLRCGLKWDAFEIVLIGAHGKLVGFSVAFSRETHPPLYDT